jgi:uncharacterized protein (TIGR04255 family)
MGKKMSRAPIYYALAQVRFNAVLALDQYVPTIQDDFRKVGFTDYQKVFLATINLASTDPAQQNQQVPAFQPVARHLFLNEARTAGFTLDQAGIIFHVTDYHTFEPFLESVLQGLDIVHRAATLSYSERIGLRFLDAICPTQGDDISAYLAPSVLGLFDKLAPRELVYAFSETRTKSGNATLVSRSVIYRQEVAGPVMFPQDLQPIPLTLGEQFKTVKGIYAVVDTDSWLEEREKFEIGGLQKRLILLHNDLSRSFELMVTPHALHSWE